ncbi:MAG: hypothetical protein AB7O66_07635 [Limisphaerales bacterium]
MSAATVVFLLVLGIALIALPRLWAPLPLLMGTCYITLGQGIAIGPFSFTFLRLLVLFAFIRIIARGERPLTGLIGLDKVVIAWAAWFVAVSFFHPEPLATLVFHLGLVYNTVGVYFALRCICIGREHSLNLIRLLALVLAPVALEMVGEHVLRRNLFAVFGGVDADPVIRLGKLRAQGPFSHPILAGTVGGVCLPMMIAIWRIYKVPAMIGVASCLLMVVTSMSSGPIMSAVFGLAAVAFWPGRHHMAKVRVAAVLLYIALSLTMKAKPYYLIARIDLTGSSTGHHRAALMESAGKHLDEWWFAGTDYTRHWMPTGVSWSEDHTDITNHYLGQGVKGGLLLMSLFIGMFVCAFRNVGITIRRIEAMGTESAFLPWCIGCCLFSHLATCISVAYFDQSIVFFNATIALSACLRAGVENADESDFASASAISDLPGPSPSASFDPGGSVSDSNQRYPELST